MDSIVERVEPDKFKLVISEGKIEAIKKRTIEQSIQVLGDRLDPTGTIDMTLIREGSDRILLQIPGANNVDEIKSRINRTANLSFHLVDRVDSSNADAMRLAAQGRIPAGKAFYPHKDGGGALIVKKRTKITGACLESASEGIHPERQNQPIVNFTFNFDCARRFGELTTNNVGERFAVVLDDEIITAPNILSLIHI